MNLTQIGYFSKTHGVKGHLILKADKPFFIDELKAVFVESATGKAPYFVTEVKESTTGIIICLEEIRAVEKARALIGKAVYVDSALIEEEEADPDWIGYEVTDKNFGVLGIVGSMSDNGQQLLLSIDHKGREVLLPLVEEFIESIDEENKKLFFNAPEGLIDVYLQDAGEDEL